MPIGYVLSVKDVLEYYGKTDISSAICRASKGRRSHITNLPQSLGGAEPNIARLDKASQVLEEAQQFLHDYLPDDIPRRYPAFHSVINRDIVLEVDVKENHKEAFEGGRKALDVLDSLNVPYRIKFSGNSSPHIIIPEEAYQHLLPLGREEEIFKKLYSFIVNECSLAGLDSSFSESNHFLRLSYSLNENTGLISVPIRADEYDDFELEMAEIGAVQIAEWWFDTQDFGDKEENIRLLLERFTREK
jgi:hypothetical protein